MADQEAEGSEAHSPLVQGADSEVEGTTVHRSTVQVAGHESTGGDGADQEANHVESGSGEAGMMDYTWMAWLAAGGDETSRVACWRAVAATRPLGWLGWWLMAATRPLRWLDCGRRER